MPQYHQFHSRGRSRPGFVNGSNGLRAGFRVPRDRCLEASHELLPAASDRSDAECCHEAPSQPHATEETGALQQEYAPTERGGLLGSGDEEDVQFLEALKGLVDGAVKLLGADKGVGKWLMSGLLRKSGMVDSFVDSMVVFVDRRIGALVSVMSPKDAAYAFARRLRQHVQAHDATTLALGVRAGRTRKSSENVKSQRGENVAESVGEGPAATVDGEETEEHDVQAVHLWRQWTCSGGFWPPQMPNPNDPVFDGLGGAEEFLSKLDEGTHLFLKEISRDILETALPEDAEELRAASGGTRGAGADSSRSFMETANRLAQLKSGVLEPMLCQMLTQQVVNRFCQSAKLWQFILQLVRPSANLSSAGRDMEHPEAFSLLAGALERSGSTPTGTLRMELMQGLVKMAWGSSRSAEDSSSTGKPGGAKKIYPDKRKITKAGSSKTLERSESADSARWSEVDIGSESGDGNVGNTSLLSAPAAAATLGKAGGARDIFSIPNTEELSQGLVGGEKDKFYQGLEDQALEELAKFLNSEIVDKIPLAKVFLPESWVSDRVTAARAFAKRPTNLMLVLSIVDAAKSVFSTAGVRDKRKSFGAPTSHPTNTPVPIAKGAVAVVSGNDPSEPSKGSRTASIPEARGQETQAGRGSGLNEVRAPSHGAESQLRRQRRRGRRDTPGWRAWEARRERFFGMDLGVVAMHVGRCLLGQEAVGLGDAILKTASLEYCSVGAVVRDEASNTLRKCSEVAVSDMLRRIKPLSTQPILYVSCQMRMLRALKKTGLDFSKSLGDGPQKKALSRRFKSYSWIFTDGLIEKLVALKAEDLARCRAMESESIATTPHLSEHKATVQREDSVKERNPRKGESRTDRGHEVKELKRERKAHKGDVMREMTAGCDSSKDLLVKVISWLPDVLAADRGKEGSVEEQAT
ncbi:unnamed protein product [Ectocarpus sp. 6 AP-2014]